MVVFQETSLKIAVCEHSVQPLQTISPPFEVDSPEFSWCCRWLPNILYFHRRQKLFRTWFIFPSLSHQFPPSLLSQKPHGRALVPTKWLLYFAPGTEEGVLLSRVMQPPVSDIVQKWRLMYIHALLCLTKWSPFVFCFHSEQVLCYLM